MGATLPIGDGDHKSDHVGIENRDADRRDRFGGRRAAAGRRCHDETVATCGDSGKPELAVSSSPYCRSRPTEQRPIVYQVNHSVGRGLTGTVDRDSRDVEFGPVRQRECTQNLVFGISSCVSW